MDKIRALQYFKRTAELKSFSLSAKEFGVPASSISRRVKDLEASLGVELLKRSTRSVNTTELGSVYYDLIVDVLQKLNDADELISQRLDALEGKITISAMPSYGEKILTPILQKFRQEYPAIILDIDYSDELISFGKDSVDIAIRAGDIPDERVVAKQLSSSEFKLVATPKLLRKLQERYQKLVLTIEDLESCPALQFRGPQGVFSWAQYKNEKWEEIPINPLLLCNSGETILAATLAHEGVAFYPLWWVNSHLTTGELVEVPIDVPVSVHQLQSLDICILYQQAKYKIPKIKLCVDYIIQHLG